MIGLTQHHNYHLYGASTDMRKGFNGLCGLVTQHMNRDVMNGEVYIFINRRRDKMKMLVWEQGGFMLYYKRLEQGTFELPRQTSQNGQISISWQTLLLMITGIKLDKIVRKKRYKIADKR
jgi:Transposase and inactivated derivatives